MSSEHSEESVQLELKEDTVESDPFLQINSLISNSRASGEEAPAFNVRLIAEVKARPHLYDHTHEGYNVIPWRSAAWQEIADALESTPESVKTRWKTLRDRFKKEDKKEKATGKPSSWAYQKPMKFVQKAGCKTEEGCAEEDEQVSPMEAAISFIEQEISRNDAASAGEGSDDVPPPPHKRRRTSITEGLLKPAPPRMWSFAEDEEDDMFARMIAARLSKLQPRTRDLAKIRMLSALYEVTDGVQP